MEQFKLDLEKLINQHSIESYADMPDFIMAEMICDFIKAIGKPIKDTLDWHGCNSICHPAKERDNG